MNHRLIFMLIVLVLFWMPLFAQDDPTLTPALGTLRSNVRATWEALPDLVCDEALSWAADNRTRVVESEISGVRRVAPMGYQIVESRRVVAIDGRRVVRNIC